MFATELTPVQSKRFLDLLSAHHEEEQRQLAILRAELSADSKPSEVVAIAGTAETLLNDVTDTNVGKINVGDTVECIHDSYPNTQLEFPPILKGTLLKVDTRFSDKVSFQDYYHSYNVDDFRKIQTPLSNPHQTVSGC
jgi:hypothetical protein